MILSFYNLISTITDKQVIHVKKFHYIDNNFYQFVRNAVVSNFLRKNKELIHDVPNMSRN